MFLLPGFTVHPVIQIPQSGSTPPIAATSHRAGGSFLPSSRLLLARPRRVQGAGLLQDGVQPGSSLSLTPPLPPASAAASHRQGALLTERLSGVVLPRMRNPSKLNWVPLPPRMRTPPHPRTRPLRHGRGGRGGCKETPRGAGGALTGGCTRTRGGAARACRDAAPSVGVSGTPPSWAGDAPPSAPLGPGRGGCREGGGILRPRRTRGSRPSPPQT